MSEVCSPPINCGLDVTPEQAFKKLIQVDVNGCAALNTVEVEADDPAASYLTCANAEGLSARALFFKMITTDVNGEWALRVIKSTV